MEGDGVTMGKAAHYLGGVGTGSKMKLVVNMTMGTMMNSLVSGDCVAMKAVGVEGRGVSVVCALSVHKSTCGVLKQASR